MVSDKDIRKKRALAFQAMKAEVERLRDQSRKMDKAIIDRDALISQLSRQGQALTDQLHKLEADYQALKEAKDEDLW